MTYIPYCEGGLGERDPTPTERAERIRQMLAQQEYDDPNDLLADFFHYLAAQESDLDEAIRVAKMHYEAERTRPFTLIGYDVTVGDDIVEHVTATDAQSAVDASSWYKGGVDGQYGVAVLAGHVTPESTR